jgi:hypothetical protein
VTEIHHILEMLLTPQRLKRHHAMGNEVEFCTARGGLMSRSADDLSCPNAPKTYCHTPPKYHTTLRFFLFPKLGSGATLWL